MLSPVGDETTKALQKLPTIFQGYNPKKTS